jgi:hypothetical protein
MPWPIRPMPIMPIFFMVALVSERWTVNSKQWAWVQSQRPNVRSNEDSAFPEAGEK